MKRLWKSFLHLLYPPACLHCGGGVHNAEDRFCKECLSLLQVIDPSERCPHCFSNLYEQENCYCPICFRQNSYIARSAAVFDYMGPAKTLAHKLKYGNQQHLAKGTAAYMAAQFIRLDWPLPDFIVPVPMPYPRKFVRGYNQSELLAEHVAEILQRPLLRALKRSSGDFSQSSLTRKEREQLSGSTFHLDQKDGISGSTLLLIDDIIVSGTTVQKCAEMLWSASPGSIYALGICKEPFLL